MKLSKLFLIVGYKYNFQFEKNKNEVKLMLWDEAHDGVIFIREKSIKKLVSRVKKIIKEMELIKDFS